MLPEGVNRSRPDGWRRELAIMLTIAASALAWRAVSAIVAFLSNVTFPLHQAEQFTVRGRTHHFWDALARYDSGWYFDIARNGYQYVEGGRNNLAFFPVYPTAMSRLGYAMGGGQANYYYAGIIISWTAFVVAMVVLYRLARLDLDHSASVRACVLAAVFPFGFFFGMVYPTSLFLCLTVMTVYGFRTARWPLGALAGALLTATRVNGVFIVPVLALILFQHWRREPAQLRRGIAALAVVPLGVAGYSAFVFLLSGSPFEWADSIRRWNYHPGGAPWVPFVTLAGVVTDPYGFLAGSPGAPYDLLNGLAALAATAATPFVWYRFGPAYGMLLLLNLVLPLSSGELEGLGRYTSVLFPMFLWLGGAVGSMSFIGLVAVFAIFHTLCQALFVNLHPIF